MPLNEIKGVAIHFLFTRRWLSANVLKPFVFQWYLIDFFFQAGMSGNCQHSDILNLIKLLATRSKYFVYEIVMTNASVCSRTHETTNVNT